MMYFILQGRILNQLKYRRHVLSRGEIIKLLWPMLWLIYYISNKSSPENSIGTELLQLKE